MALKDYSEGSCFAILLLTFLWLVSLPLVLLGIGFSGGEILSAERLYADVISGDPYLANRLWAWFVVLYPVIMIAVLARQWWKGNNVR